MKRTQVSVHVNGLLIYGYHGVYDEERSLGQQFRFDIKCCLDTTASFLDDTLTGSVRYDQIVAVVRAVASEASFRTLEALAETVLHSLIEQFDAITRLTVRVSKPSPPIDAQLESVGVEMSAQRSSSESTGSCIPIVGCTRKSA